MKKRSQAIQTPRWL